MENNSKTNMTPSKRILRIILGDQLNLRHSWFKTIDNQILYVMMEVRQETDYVLHHIQKMLAFFAAMREFARQLQAKGNQVYYIKLDDLDNTQSIPDNLIKILIMHQKRFNTPQKLIDIKQYKF